MLWTFLLIAGFFRSDIHPVHVSVVTIEHNYRQRVLEISCRTFTDDMEKTLRNGYSGKVDLLRPAKRSNMDSLLSRYLQSHLTIMVNRDTAALSWVGYEQDQDAVLSYFEVGDVDRIDQIQVVDNILYDFSSRQVSIIHVRVADKELSRQLTNPEDKAEFLF